MTKVIDTFVYGNELIYLTEKTQIRIDELNGLIVFVPRESRKDLSGVMIARIQQKSNGSLQKKYLLDRAGVPLIATLTRKPYRQFDIRVPAWTRN